jgi:hypothetical protein
VDSFTIVSSPSVSASSIDPEKYCPSDTLSPCLKWRLPCPFDQFLCVAVSQKSCWLSPKSPLTFDRVMNVGVYPYRARCVLNGRFGATAFAKMYPLPSRTRS